MSLDNSLTFNLRLRDSAIGIVAHGRPFVALHSARLDRPLVSYVMQPGKPQLNQRARFRNRAVEIVLNGMPFVALHSVSWFDPVIMSN